MLPAASELAPMRGASTIGLIPPSNSPPHLASPPSTPEPTPPPPAVRTRYRPSPSAPHSEDTATRSPRGAAQRFFGTQPRTAVEGSLPLDMELQLLVEFPLRRRAPKQRAETEPAIVPPGHGSFPFRFYNSIPGPSRNSLGFWRCNSARTLAVVSPRNYYPQKGRCRNCLISSTTRSLR